MNASAGGTGNNTAVIGAKTLVIKDMLFLFPLAGGYRSGELKDIALKIFLDVILGAVPGSIRTYDNIYHLPYFLHCW